MAPRKTTKKSTPDTTDNTEQPTEFTAETSKDAPHNFDAGADGSESCLVCGGDEHILVHGFLD